MSLQILSVPSRPRTGPAAARVVGDALDAACATRVGTPLVARGEVDVVLDLRHAGRRALTLRYERFGDVTLPTVFVAGGISADRHVAASAALPGRGWWDAQCGDGKALDPRRHSVLAFDWLGADGCLDVPLDPADQADAIAALLDALRVERLQAFIGCSYGAMVGLQFAAAHSSRLSRLVAISGCHRSHPHASAWRALQRRAVALGALQCDDSHGLALARQLAILSYRTSAEFDRRFEAATVVGDRVRVGAEDYLDHCGATFANRFAPTAFVRLSESIDLQALNPESIRVPVTVVAVADDRLVPVSDAVELAERLRGDTRLHILQSLYGHDAFLKEGPAISAILSEALAGQEVAA